MLKVEADDRWWMDRGRRTETYEYYRAKKIRDDEEFLDIFEWKKMKRKEKN
jgi:hypothetical protein